MSKKARVYVAPNMGTSKFTDDYNHWIRWEMVSQDTHIANFKLMSLGSYAKIVRG